MFSELKSNTLEFYESGEDNFLKKRYNARASDYFKTIEIVCDFLFIKK